MKIQKAEIVMSAARPEQFPETGLPEFALAGRSNVGKSSFINSMLRRKKLARTSSNPGRTITLNFFEINEEFYFVDVPGYGYAKRSKDHRAEWGPLLQHYLTTRETLKAVILIIDARHKAMDTDLQMYDFLAHYGIPTIIVATKADKLKKGQQAKQKRLLKEAFQVEEGDEFIMYSSETGMNKEVVWNAIRARM